MIGDSCEINDKVSSCCSTPTQPEQINYKEHWDKTYSKSPEEKLGWYETDLTPTLEMIDKTLSVDSSYIPAYKLVALIYTIQHKYDTEVKRYCQYRNASQNKI